MHSVSSSTLPAFEEARHIVERHASQTRSPETESVNLLSALGRVLAEPLIADRDFPPFRRVMRDGYAVRATDLTDLPAKLEVVGEIKAGASQEEMPTQIRERQAAAIMTGAPAPDGADAVVMVEYTSQRGKEVTITRGVASGDNIVPAGSEARQGQKLLDSGTRIDYPAIAIAASVGKSQLSVFRRPRVSIVATGDELVEVREQPAPYQIRNSNTYSLAAQVEAAGGIPVLSGIARDEAGELRAAFQNAFQSDLVLLAGGVSMGKYDLVEQVLGELGAEFFFTGALIQPGRPVVFGRAREKYFFGLPGNPVSTMVTFELFARPMLEALGGAKPRRPVFFSVRLKREIKVRPGLTRFLPGLLSGQFGELEVELAPWQGSGDIAGAARANCYVVVPPDRERIAAGETVAAWMKS